MQMSDYSELKRLAEAATPGPWQTELEYPIIQPAYPARGSIASALIWQDANFISAANPAAVLALIAEVEALRKDAERWRFFNAVANDLQAFPHSWGLMTKEKMDFMCDEAMDADRKGNEP